MSTVPTTNQPDVPEPSERVRELADQIDRHAGGAGRPEGFEWPIAVGLIEAAVNYQRTTDAEKVAEVRDIIAALELAGRLARGSR